MIDLLLIGNGKWGKNYISTLQKFPNVRLKIADRNNWQELIKKVNGVIIATPPDSHIDLALYALDRNLPVMIEKPLALSYKEAKKLLPYKNKIPILINHLHLFAPAFEYLIEVIDPNKIIDIKSIGTNLSPTRNYSTLFDWGCHDLSMGMYLSNAQEIIIKYVEKLYTTIGEGFCLELKYNNMLKYNISHNIEIGNYKEKNRYLEINLPDNQYIYDDTKNNKLYLNNNIINVNSISPLENALIYFLRALDTGKTDTRFDLDLSLKGLKVLDEANNMLK